MKTQFVWLLTSCTEERIKPDDALDMGEVYATEESAKKAATKRIAEFFEEMGEDEPSLEWAPGSSNRCQNAEAGGIFFRLWKVLVQS